MTCEHDDNMNNYELHKNAYPANHDNEMETCRNVFRGHKNRGCE